MSCHTYNIIIIIHKYYNDNLPYLDEITRYICTYIIKYYKYYVL